MLVAQLLEWMGNDSVLVLIPIREELSKIRSLNIITPAIEGHLVAFLVDKLEKSPDILREASIILWDMDQGLLVGRYLSKIIPKIMMDRNKNLLQRISAVVGTSIEELLLQQAHTILTFLLLHANDSGVPEATHFLLLCLSSSTKGNVSLLQLIWTCRQRLVNNLGFALGSDEESKRKSAEKALLTIGQTLDSKRSAPVELASFLQSYILGTMHEFSNTRLAAGHDAKEQVLRALIQIMNCMGSGISNVASQVRSGGRVGMISYYFILSYDLTLSQNPLRRSSTCCKHYKRTHLSANSLPMDGYSSLIASHFRTLLDISVRSSFRCWSARAFPGRYRKQACKYYAT